MQIVGAIASARSWPGPSCGGPSRPHARRGLRDDEIGLVKINTQQARDADRRIRALQSRHLFLHLPVRHRHPPAQPHVFRPRIDDVALDEAAILRQIAKHPPAAGPIAPPRGLHLANAGQERGPVRRIDPILDLNQHRTVIRLAEGFAQRGSRQGLDDAFSVLKQWLPPASRPVYRGWILRDLAQLKAAYGEMDEAVSLVLQLEK